MHILITGVAGFIGANTASQLLALGHKVSSIDDLNDYYDPNLKAGRLARLLENEQFYFIKAGIQEPGVLKNIFKNKSIDVVIHLAAQAGVRYSIDNPRVYLESNLVGTFELLEAARNNPPKHMLLASTSSAYGANTDMPYRETQKADHQMSFYAATKKATEAMAHSYAHLYQLPITMFRFFTVYGPWGRPDMAPMKFTNRILNGSPIDIYNHGEMKRDFTYVDDVVNALSLLLNKAPGKTPISATFDSLSPVAPFRVVNIGNNRPVRLKDFITALEKEIGRKAIQNLMDMQPGDVPATWADTRLLQALTGYSPTTDLCEGVKSLVDWYLDYYRDAISFK
jgi:UDP-glucuronate 4-epimerase